jgi:hypothetical protein
MSRKRTPQHINICNGHGLGTQVLYTTEQCGFCQAVEKADKWDAVIAEAAGGTSKPSPKRTRRSRTSGTPSLAGAGQAAGKQEADQPPAPATHRCTEADCFWKGVPVKGKRSDVLVCGNCGSIQIAEIK